MRFYFARTTRRHKIGRGHALAALAAAGAPTRDTNGDLCWIAPDDRGIELEIVGFEAQEDPNLVVIKHVMSTGLRRKP